MNIRQVLEGLNIDNKLINNIDDIMYLKNFTRITSIKYDNNRLFISFKLSDEMIEDESYINITIPKNEFNRYLVNIYINEFISNRGRVSFEDDKCFNIKNMYTFEYESKVGICGYSCQHSLVEIHNEPINEEIVGLNQNDYNIFVFNNSNVKSYGKEKFLSLLGVSNKDFSNLDMILLGRNYFINSVNSKELSIDTTTSLSLKMK